MSKILDYTDVKAGDEAPVKSLKVDQGLIDNYAHICGDYNPIHVDLEEAAKTIFKGTIAHGTINAEPILEAIGNYLGTYWPTEGTKVDLQFRSPVRPGDTISSKIAVKQKKPKSFIKAGAGKNTLICDISAVNDKGTECVRGTAEIVVP
ncbi:MAG: MaoC/PaaZ C-terminal domain-containing protein [Proteobacteria bacterium]|nr:MaoC/PaaZ C-terminal domain-containing protein [Pseudomonadota bacterium]